MTLLAFAIPFILFILQPSHMWNFDGVACAAALELENPIFLFHSNHLLYGALGFLFWKPLSLHWIPRALPALQLFTSLLSAVGLVGLYAIFKKLLPRRELAVLLTCGISAAAVVWVWSIEAQVYALGFLAIAWATHALFQPDSSRKWLKVGLLHALAILGHVVHVLWLIPALCYLKREAPAGAAVKARTYALTTFFTVLIPYALVIGLIIVPQRWNDRWLVRWLLGSASLNPNSVFEWHFAGWQGPLDWLRTTPKLFWGSFWPYHTSVPLWAAALTAFSIAAVVLLLAMSWRRRRDPRWLFSWIWIGVYAVFFWTWEPTMECYRMTDVIPIGILLALGLAALRKSQVRWICASTMAATLVAINWATRIQPMHDGQNNPVYQETMAVAKETPDHSLYLTNGGIRWIYLLYFTGRSAWNLNSFARNPERLGEEVGRHMGHQPVFVHVDALKTDLIQFWITRYRQTPLPDSIPWVRIQ